MRNVFDQYQQPENRLTHALVCALGEDGRLLRRFVRWSTGRAAPKGRISIVEQQRPGEEIGEESLSAGMPDAWIFNDNGWCVLIESKITAQISTKQLRRHLATAAKRDFSSVRLLLLTARKDVPDLGEEMGARRWTDIYEWLRCESARSDWAGRCLSYMEVLESRLIEDEKLREGALTTFSGIPFDDRNPYSYLEAKRLLKMAVESLRRSTRLKRELRMDPGAQGRSAITGKRGAAVWDFLRLKDSTGAKDFTRYPHLTIAVEHDRLLAMVTIPNGVRPELRRKLVRIGAEGFRELLSDLTGRISKALQGDPGASPAMIVVQRRYLTQRSAAIVDAKLEFDLRTSFGGSGKAGRRRVKRQPQWLDATFDALSRKKSNLQVAIGASFPFATSSTVHERGVLRRVESAWLACKPLLSAMGLGVGR